MYGEQKCNVFFRRPSAQERIRSTTYRTRSFKRGGRPTSGRLHSIATSMAYRHLISLARRVRKPLFSSSPAIYCVPRNYVAAQRIITEDLYINKLQNRLFSGTSFQKKGSGKVANTPQKSAHSEGQSSASQAPVNKESLAQSGPGTSNSQQQSWLKYLLAATLVLGLVTFFPWDLLQDYYVGKKEQPSVPHEDLKQINAEQELKNHVTDDLKHPSLVQEEESLNVVIEPKSENLDENALHKGTIDGLESSNKSANRAEGELMSDTKDQEATQRTEKVSLLASQEQKESDIGLKDKVSQLSVHSKDEESRNVSAENLPGGYAGNKPSTSGKADEKLNVPQEQKDGSVNTKEPEFIHAESVSVSNRPSLLEAYYLNQRIIQGNEQHAENKNDSSPDVPGDMEEYERVKETDFVNRVHTESAPNIVDVLELVHAAERRQAELDAQVHEEANKKLKQAFQKELKNAQAREAMYADEVNNLAREIMLEKEKAASALELERKMAEEKLHEELRRKEEEADLKLKKAELLSKSEIAAAVAEEKLTYMKDVRNVKQELEALDMILSTQSEDFHQSHTVHKLAVGAFALEDAMKKGGALNKEISLISSSYGDSGSDPLLDAVISCIPEAAIKRGTLTPSQLSQKFEDLKSEVLELSLIPSTGGGLISHVAAKLVSAMKVKESGRHPGGIAAAVSKVQCYLAEGKLSDAAEVLESGVQGTKAEVVVADWVKSARDRAVMEQMLLLLQAHATATASSLA